MGRKRDLGVLLWLVALVGIVGRWLSEPVHLDSLDLTVGGPGYHFVLQATWSGADYRADGRFVSDGVVTGHLTAGEMRNLEEELNRAGAWSIGDCGENWANKSTFALDLRRGWKHHTAHFFGMATPEHRRLELALDQTVVGSALRQLYLHSPFTPGPPLMQL